MRGSPCERGDVPPESPRDDSRRLHLRSRSQGRVARVTRARRFRIRPAGAGRGAFAAHEKAESGARLVVTVRNGVAGAVELRSLTA